MNLVDKPVDNYIQHTKVDSAILIYLSTAIG